MNICLRFVSIGIFLCFFISGCQQYATHSYQEQEAFFSQPRYNGNYFKTFNLLEADTVVRHIQTEVPLQWQDFACQRAYYTMAGVEGVTDSILFRYLDVVGKAFPNDSTLAFTQIMRGDLFVGLARYDTASVCFQKAYDLCLKSRNDLLAASAINGFAQLALCQNDYPEATKLYLRNYEYFSSLDTAIEKGRVFNVLKKLGNVYTKSQNLPEAYKWYLKAWEFAMTGSPTRRILYTVESGTLLAQSYLALNQLDSAQMMLDTVVHFQKINGNFYEEELREMLRAKIQLKRGNCVAALTHAWSAKRKNTTPTKPIKTQLFNKELADTYACLGRLDSAIYFYQMALTTPDSVQQIAILEALSKVYILRGDYSKAFDYEQRGKELEKRIFTKEREQTIGRLQAKLELEKRERTLEAQQNQYRLNQMLIVGTLMALVLSLIVTLLLYRRKQQELHLAAQKEIILEQQKYLAEYEAFRKEEGLKKAEVELTIKKAQLEETMSLLDLKNKLIEELRLTLVHSSTNSVAQDNYEEMAVLTTVKFKNLKILTPEDWLAFRKLFEEYFPNFFIYLRQSFPKLTTAETRLFLLIKLGFNNTEVSEALGISSTSVYVSRSRLRQRLALGKEADLEEFIQGF